MLWKPTSMPGMVSDIVMEPELSMVPELEMRPELLMVPPERLLMVPPVLPILLELSMRPPELLLMIPLVLLSDPLFDIVMMPEFWRMTWLEKVPPMMLMVPELLMVLLLRLMMAVPLEF